jgi:hypothetical protein
MKVSVQASDLAMLREAVSSSCTGLRFGSEFCEHLLPSLRVLERAHALACEKGKEFTYVTPRLSNAGIDRLKEQLAFLSEKGEVGVVANDFGALSILRRHPNLHPHLGRNLFLVPARSAWTDGHIQSEEPSSERGKWIRDLYASTSLNYQATIELYRRYGCHRADVDWIPHILPALAFLVEKGLHLSAHLQLVPVTFTRRCHTARFLGEKRPETCSRPCLRRAFVLENEALEEYEAEFGLQLYLHGNTVFRVVQPSREDIARLQEAGVAELVVTMSPITGIDTATRIDDFIMAHCPSKQ